MDGPQRLDVMHVLAPAAFGGAESVVRALVEGHAQRGHAVGAALLLEDESSHPFESALAQRGALVTSVRAAPRAYLQEARSLAALFTRLHPALVHTHGFRADVQAGRVAARLRIPRISTVHGFTGGGARVRVYEWLQVQALRRFEAVVVVSRPLEAQLARRGVRRERLHLLRNAWVGGAAGVARAEARAALDLPADAFVLGWVGRLSAEKGADVLIEALARLQGVPALACVIGDGPDRPALERRAAELGLDGRVRFLGSVPRETVLRLFRAADASVLPSAWENFPHTVVEALAVGCPVIATSVGGVPEVVRDGENGLLVVPNDAAALGEAIERFFTDAALRERLATAAPTSVAGYSEETVFSTIETELERAVSR